MVVFGLFKGIRYTKKVVEGGRTQTHENFYKVVLSQILVVLNGPLKMVKTSQKKPNRLSEKRRMLCLLTRYTARYTQQSFSFYRYGGEVKTMKLSLPT